MKIILVVAAVVIIVGVFIVIKLRSEIDPDKEIQKNNTSRMTSLYKK